jgi:hypothetical protein
MADKKSAKKQKDSEKRGNEIAEQLEHAFMAGLGALSDAQQKGAKTFDSLVKEGEKFRKKTRRRSVEGDRPARPGSRQIAARQAAKCIRHTRSRCDGPAECAE